METPSGTPAPADNEANMQLAVAQKPYNKELKEKYEEAADKECKRWGSDKLLFKIGGTWAVNIVGCLMTIQFLMAFLVMGHWAGAAGYTWFLTLAPMCLWLILLINDVDMSLNYQRQEKYFFHRVLVEMTENSRERAYCIRRSLAYVYLCSVFASFMFGIFGSWGMGQKFWGLHCTLPRGCDNDHTAFIIFIVVRVFFQFHVFWVLLCHAANIKEAQKCYNCGQVGPFTEDCPEEEVEPLIPVIVKKVEAQTIQQEEQCLSGQLSLQVVRAKINDARSHAEFENEVVSACIIREQEEEGIEAKVHVSETMNGVNPEYAWKCNVQVTNCEEPFTIEIGSFGDVIGKESIRACCWRDGTYKTGELISLTMGHGDVTIYVQAEWIGDDQEFLGHQAVTENDANAKAYIGESLSKSIGNTMAFGSGMKMSNWEKLSHTKKD